MWNGGSCYGNGASICIEAGAEWGKVRTMPWIMRHQIPMDAVK